MYFEKMQKKKWERKICWNIDKENKKCETEYIYFVVMWEWLGWKLIDGLLDYQTLGKKLIDRFNQNECWDKLVQYSKRGKLYVLSHEFVLFIMLPVHVQCNSS